MNRRKFLKRGSLFIPAAIGFPYIVKAQTVVSGSVAMRGAAALQGSPVSGGGGGSSPVGWWKLNDGSGTSAVDSSGNGFTGTLSGADVLPTWGAGPNSEGAVVFDSANNNGYIDCGSSSTLKLTSTGTVMSWIKYSNAMGTFRQFISNENGGSNRDGFALQILSSTKASLDLASASANINIIGGTGLVDSTWYHVAATWDGSFIDLYVNGVSDATHVAQTLNASAGGNFTIGWDGSHTGTVCARGVFMDDVRAYSTALTSAEVLTIYNAGAQ